VSSNVPDGTIVATNNAVLDLFVAAHIADALHRAVQPVDVLVMDDGEELIPCELICFPPMELLPSVGDGDLIEGRRA
jgi:hypothetical protein